MNFIDSLFFIYSFVGLYMFSLFMFLYVSNKHKFHHDLPAKIVPISIIIPCFNAESRIIETIDSLFKMDYPKDKLEIIVVDDKSTDKTVEIVKRYCEKHSNIRLIINKINSGSAAEPTNLGVKAAKYDFITVTDDDTSPAHDALKKMLSYIQENEKIAAVTCSVLTKHPKGIIQRMQYIEYQIISFNRKILDIVDSVYVTPGAFALYRKKALLKVGLFDKTNMTQDIEIVWRLLNNGYQVSMCLPAKVYTTTPDKITKWWKQRIRWDIGGIQTLVKYKALVFQKGMLGNFIIPYFAVSMFLGLVGLILFAYLITRSIIIYYLSTKYSIYASTAILSLQEFSFSPSILNYIGIVLFLLGAWLTFFSLNIVKQDSNRNVFNVLLYLIIYLPVYPFIMIHAMYNLARGKYKW